MATKTKAAEVDVMAVLAGAATQKAEKASKSKVPALQVTPELMRLAAKKQELVKKMDELKAEDELVSADIIDGVTPIYEEKCSREFMSSVKVPALDGTNITVTWKSAYSAISTEKTQEIKDVVGSHFDRWFTKQTTITVKDQSPEFLKQLIDMVGAENFAKFFGVEQAIVPTATFTEEKYRVLDKSQREALSGTVKQYKPAIRAK